MFPPWKHWIRFTFCCALLSVTPVRADEPAARSEQLESTVTSLVNDLESEKRSIRVAAESELKKLGPTVLPLLPSPEILTNAAARESIRRVRILLEKQHAEELSQASTVTLAGKFTLAEIVDALHEQTSNEIVLVEVDESAQQQPLDVNFKATPFWRAWDDLLERTNLVADFDRGMGALRLQPRVAPPVDNPVVYAGPFRMEITSIRRIDQLGENKPQRLRLGLRMLGEPRLRPLFLKYKSSNIVLATVGGEMLPSATPNAKWDLPWGIGEMGIDLRWDFLIPADLAATEAMLNGEVRIELASATERFVFDRLGVDSRMAQRRGGVTVALEKVETREGETRTRTDVRISVQYDAGGPAFESHRNWMFHNQTLLTPTRQSDENGRPRVVRPDDFITEQQGDGTFEITYRFDNLSGDVHDYRFEYRAPTLLLTVPVEFTFPQIDIPGPQTEK